MRGFARYDSIDVRIAASADCHALPVSVPQKRKDKWDKILANKLNFASVIATVADCENFIDRRGAAAWVRVQNMYDPQGLTTVVNRIVALIGTYQNGAAW